MKKVKQIIFALLILNSALTFAQNFPQGINYQAVARDANGNARVNQQIPVQFTIYQSSTTGTVVWQERQLKTTNSMGQFNAVIGTGAPVTPFNTTSFAQINWGLDSTFLKVEINANISFTGVFSQIGAATKFQSVPYAMYAMNNNLKVPTAQRFLTGSGTYATPSNVLYIKVKMCGGGGGGAGYPSAGNPGSATTFGPAFLIAGGGAGGEASATPNGGVGGSFTINPGAITIIGLSGGSGGGGTNSNITAGGDGGNNPFGGSGGSGGDNRNAQSAIANSGGGGGGGGAFSGGTSVGGGGAGGFIEVIITNPSATYNYSIGTGGVGGVGSTAGGNGATGIIIIEEYYQ